MTPKSGILALLVATCCLAAVRLPARAADFTFDQPTGVQKIFEIIATIGRFNVVVSPLIRSTLPLRLVGVDPTDAMHQVARTCNLTVVEATMASGSRTTYLIVPQGQQVRPAGPDSVAGLPTADFTFKQDTDVSAIAAIVSTMGKFNVLVDPTIRFKMALELRQVRPLEALYLVANVLGLAVEPARGKTGEITYILKPHGTPPR